MPEPHTLRSQDVRALDRLVGECREVGHEPSHWHRHLFAGLVRFFGVLLVAGGEATFGAPEGRIEFVSAYGESDDAAALERFAAYHDADGGDDDPNFRALTRQSGQLITRTRAQLVSDAAWYRSASFQQFRRPAGIDHKALSIHATSQRAISGISIHGALGERPFTERERSQLEFVHASIGRLIGGPLVSETERGPETLSPRLRQTLACLLEGDGEKQVAARLALSPATVHQYVTALYRHFGVGSRAQLLAHAAKRLEREPWRSLRAQLGDDPSRAGGPDLSALSPRLRQTLACLLEGESEKQVAMRLALSPATVHQYVTAVYRHFGVRSRAQLLAYVASPWTAEARARLIG